MPGVHVEQWLKSLQLANATKAKLRNLLSAVCSHALRNRWMREHPIQGKVRQSAKATQKQVPLELEQAQALWKELSLLPKIAVLLTAGGGLRRGEVLALKWQDIDFVRKTMTICKSVWYQHVGPTKTDGSERSLPLDDQMIAWLLHWRSETMYAADSDWVFASAKMKGRQPLWPEGLLSNHIQPAARRAGIQTRVTWHTFRHTFSTRLIDNEVDVKTAQAMMGHANPSLTLRVYAHAVDSKKRAAQSALIEGMLPKQLPA